MILNVSRSIDRLETVLKSFIKKPLMIPSEELEKLSLQFKDLHENLKQIDYSKSLSLLNLIGGCIESYFSSNLKSEKNFSLFCLFLLKTLEVYSKIFSSPDSHNKKFRKRIFSIFSKVSAQLLSKDNSPCFTEVFFHKISPTPIDGSLFILKTLVNIGRVSHLEDKDFENFYFYFLVKINENFEFRASILTQGSVVCCEKFVKILELLEELQENSLASNAVLEKRETLKENFLLACKIVLNHSMGIRIWGVESEELLKKMFGAMTRFLVKFTSNYAYYQQFYDVPVIITHLLLAEFPEYKSLLLFQTLKSLIMQEILEFYSEKFKKFQESIQIGIEDLLLSNFLFEENSKDQQDLWDQILSMTIENLPSIDPLIKSISSKIPQNIENFSYLSGLNQLMNSVLSTTKKPIEECTFNQIICEIIEAIKTSTNQSIKEMLFQLLTFIFQFAILSQKHQISVLNLFFMDILVKDPENSFFFPGILSNILKTAETETVEYVLTIVQQSKDQKFTELLVLAVTKLIFGSDDIDEVLKKLVEAGFLKICVKRLENNGGQQIVVENWTSTFEILKIIRVQRKIVIFEFRVDLVVKIFRGFDEDLKQVIIEQTADNLVEIVIGKDGSVIYPPGCIILVEFLLSCEISNEKYEKLLKILLSTKELFIFSENHFLSTMLHHIKAFPKNPTIDKLSTQLVESMKIMLNLKDFSNFINLILSPGSNRRYFLLKTLRNALSMKNKLFSYSKSLILPSKHSIEWKSKKKSSIPQSKSFSIYFWVFFSEDSNILDLFLPQETISITIHSFQLQLKINNVIHVETDFLPQDNWYLVVISSNSIKNDRKYSVFIATTSEQVYRKEFSVRTSSPNELQKIIFSSSLKPEEKKTLNRVKNLNILGKVLGFKEVLEISKISWRYSLMGFPFHEDIDLKTVNEIQDSVIVTWEEVSAKYAKKSPIFENSQIFDVVRVYSPTRLLYELCHKTEDLKELFEIFNICERIICFSNYFMIFDDFFIHFLGFYFNQKLVDVRINEVFLDIIKSAPDRHNKVLFDSYLHNTKSMFLLQQSKKRMEEVIQKFIKLKPFSKVNLMKFCRLVNGLPFEPCVAYLKGYLLNNIEKNVEEVVSVLIHLVNINNIFMIRCFLEVFLQDSIQLTLDSKLFVVLLHIIEEKHDTELQVCLVKTLFSKISYDKDEDTPEKITNWVSQILPDAISKELFEFLLVEGLQSSRFKGKIRIAMVNIALCHVKVIKDSSQLAYLNQILMENSEKIVEFVYLTDFFPSWLVFAVKSSGYTKELLDLNKTILSAVINKNGQDLGKLQDIFSEVPNSELFIHLFTSLKDFSVEKHFQIFCILWAFPAEVISKDIEKILVILKFLQENDDFMASVGKSIEIKYVSNKLIDSEDCESCLIAGEIVKFYLHLIKNHKKSKELVLIIQNLYYFLDKPSVQFFSRYFQTSRNEFKSKESCESYLSIFLFYSVLKNYYKNSAVWADFIQSFIKKSHILKKIAGIMNENLSKSLFYRISISKSTAIIPSGALSMSSLENSSINEMDDYCFGFDYDALKENSKICEILYEQNQTPIFNIIEKTNPTWKVLFNSLAIATKNYLKLDIRWRTNIFSSYGEAYEPFDSGNIYRTLKEIQEDPWFSIFSEETEKERFKVEYELRNYVKSTSKSSDLFQRKNNIDLTLRQRYDKFYRWVFLKPKKQKIPLESLPPLPEMKKAQTESPSSPNHFSPVPRYSMIESLQLDPFALFTCPADYVKVQGTCFGRISISKKFFEFVSSNDSKPISGVYSFSSLECSMVLKKVRHIWTFSEISEVVLRKFIHQHSSFELVLSSGRSFLFNVFQEEIRREIVNLIQVHKNVAFLGKALQTEAKVFTEDWKKGKVSNFEYLVNLNRIAGRSFNDLFQYPVFPWVVTCFSQEVESGEEMVFRNLAFPVSAQTEKAREDGISKYLSCQDDCVSPFIFGSHYSNSGIVLHYLLRLEPYTTQAKALQDGAFDVGDRLFFSLDKAWSSTQCGGGDCKELIPELFYQPWALNSCSEQVFGCTYQGQEIIHLQVPLWAVSNWDFIKKHRLLLESAVVSQGLPSWIDLIFGFKQKGEKALQACNVFSPDTYDDFFLSQKNKISNTDLQSYIEKIYHFGQTPSQIFKTKPHGKKEDLSNCENIFGKGVFSEIDYGVFEKEERKKGVFVAGFVLKTLVISVRLIDKAFYISKFQLKSLEDNANLAIVEYHLKHFTFSKFKSLPQHKFLRYSCKTFAVFKEKLLLSALHKSCSILVHNLKGDLVQTLFFHSEVVSCVNSSESQIFSGSLDSSLVSWSLKGESFHYTSSFFGHSEGISQIEVLDSYSVLISSSLSGLILIHDIRNSECLVKIDSKCDFFKVSDLGFIAICHSTLLTFFHITGYQIYQEDLHLTPLGLEFSLTGDYCLLFIADQIIVKDPTDMRLQKTWKISKVFYAKPHPVSKTLAIWKNFEKSESAFCTGKVDAKSFRKHFMNNIT